MKFKLERIDIPVDEILKKRGIQTAGPVQKFMESELIRRCIDYIPMDTGLLAGSGTPFPKPGDGYVMWRGPYAHYMYMGEIYGPNIPMVIGGEETFRSPAGAKKQPTGRKLTYSLEKHPLAGSHWVERMMADQGDALLNDVAAMAGGKAKR